MFNLPFSRSRGVRHDGGSADAGRRDTHAFLATAAAAIYAAQGGDPRGH